MNSLIIPEHIAIIMDGNGRWSKKRALPIKIGHKQGAETLRKVADYAIELSVSTLTVFAFSTENWKRSEKEVADLMELMNHYLDRYTREAKDKNTKVKIIGDISPLSGQLKDKISQVENVTKDKTGLNLNIAINYGGRDDIVRAARKFAAGAAMGETENLTEDGFARLLDTGGFKDPDLLIRTSGESRISNFMLWQTAYSELYFSDKLWPDFNKLDLVTAIEEYSRRKRTYGGR